ncbi:transmembrane emp24 domain-containing protein 10-like isoform X2 [Pyxicephalus adspersus]|uniref:transmembrane emp24 domain-containing protein 10-like isoform X2 n=1 Tax=Pyxicephalus adspersus TaxID=30357 RepID=UPI003B5CA872
MVRLLQLLGPCLVLVGTGAISFYLPAENKKCLKEEIHKDVLVTGEYEVSEQHGIVTHLKVTDSIGHILYSKEDAKKGKFAFTTDEYENYEVCFESISSSDSVRFPDQLIMLDIKHGVEAKNYEDLAKAEKLKPLEVSLRRLEDLSQSIIKDFSYMKKREEEMSDTNGLVLKQINL